MFSFGQPQIRLLATVQVGEDERRDMGHQFRPPSTGLKWILSRLWFRDSISTGTRSQ